MSESCSPTLARVAAVVRRTIILMLALVVLAYVPLAATSMWFTVLPGFPRWQEQLDAWWGGHAYAWGSGSVAAVRSAAYVDHRVALLVHTTFGAIALSLLLVQATLVLRARRRTDDPTSMLHRRIGWLYAGSVSASILASFVFLVRAPHVDLPGQTAFRLQLWLLGASTIGTLVAGLAAQRRGDREAHRAWIVLNGCFLMTAPLLRLMWSALGALVPGHTMLTNLEVSAVSLAVVAPAVGAAACASLRTIPRISDRAVLLTVAVGVTGEVLVVNRFASLTGPGTIDLYPWFHVVPVGAFGVLLRRSGLLVALAAVPWVVLAAGGLLGPWLGEAEGLRAGLLCAPGFPLVLALVCRLRAVTRESYLAELAAVHH